MKRYSLSIGLTVFTCAVVVIAYIVTSQRPGATRLKLIPAVAVERPLNGLAIPIGPYFVRAHRHHLWCKQPTSLTKRGIHGVWRQRFQRCEMAIGPVKVYGLPSATSQPPPVPPLHPNPTATGPAVVATSLPTPRFPTAIPSPPTPLPVVTPVPTASNHTASCQQGSTTDCALMLVDFINAERSQHGIAPLSYSSLLTNGAGTCIGAIGHAAHMANDLHTIAHDQFPADVCAGTSLGENVGVSAYGSLYADAMQIHNGMAAEPYSNGCQGNHHCDWMDPSHTYVGIAFVAGTFQGLAAHYESEEYSNAG